MNEQAIFKSSGNESWCVGKLPWWCLLAIGCVAVIVVLSRSSPHAAYAEPLVERPIIAARNLPRPPLSLLCPDSENEQDWDEEPTPAPDICPRPSAPAYRAIAD